MSKDTAIKAIVGAKIFDGDHFHRGHALIFRNDEIIDICPAQMLPANSNLISLKGGTIAPGFIDLQVNGGGGILFNEHPTVEGIRTICQAHAKFGTCALLPTLISDTPVVTKQAIEASIEAHKQKIPGFLGLHLEGPHLSQERKGAHDPNLIRTMQQGDLELLLWANEQLPNLKITIAPETVSNEQIGTLAYAGITVSLGHTNCTYEAAIAAFAAGAKSVTHLYNAMSPLTHREPGLVGAALTSSAISAGLIADGHHVQPAAMKIALDAKRAPGNMFLVTDAMSTIGTDQKSFELNGRRIDRTDGVLTLDDGTLAGADLDMISAVANIQTLADVSYEEALKMASLYPAQCIGVEKELGRLNKGAPANMVHINEQMEIENVWVGGSIIN